MRIRPDPSGEKPAPATVEYKGRSLFEADLLERRFDAAEGQLSAVVEFVMLGDGEAVLLVGVRKCLLFGRTGVQEVALNRSRSDDRGFYSTEVLEYSFGVVLVYEGGLVAVTNDGQIPWTRCKHWDEVMAERTAETIDLVDQDGVRISIDASSGQQVE